MDVDDKQVPLVTAANGNGTLRENGYVTNIDNADRFGFTNLPYREPIDLQFKDITYTVKMGWNKGNEHIFFLLSPSLSSSDLIDFNHFPISLILICPQFSLNRTVINWFQLNVIFAWVPSERARMSTSKTLSKHLRSHELGARNVHTCSARARNVHKINFNHSFVRWWLLALPFCNISYRFDISNKHHSVQGDVRDVRDWCVYCNLLSRFVLLPCDYYLLSKCTLYGRCVVRRLRSTWWP